ncbi:hypothetical protein OH76DRAFT_1408123 [Lentinus brumalis]|uniref:Uncharacterized protein n=1 Tax=Lentinus brumalis TaxID=2498619 RepID=A0A371CYK0_9APHY|nr:hypothetical protein OH76DRAFT_1408123 [Polyporus brumalis]
MFHYLVIGVLATSLVTSSFVSAVPVPSPFVSAASDAAAAPRDIASVGFIIGLFCVDANFEGQCVGPDVTIGQCVSFGDFANKISSLELKQENTACKVFADTGCTNLLASFTPLQVVNNVDPSINDKISAFLCEASE